MSTLILASSSPYRRELLQRLGLPFTHQAPDIDEAHLANELPEDLVQRLALEKAQAVAKTDGDALIIGSDQVAVLDGEIIGKPHSYENAIGQLQKASNRTVTFLTSLCLLNSATQKYQISVEPFIVEFLPLSDKQIDAYLNKEQPYQCAGSFKSEGLGITLFKRFIGDDPNSLIGLPLIKLVEMLRNEGVEPLS